MSDWDLTPFMDLPSPDFNDYLSFYSYTMPESGESSEMMPRSMEPPLVPVRSMEPPATPVRPMEPPLAPVRSMEPPAMPLRPLEPPPTPIRPMGPPRVQGHNEHGHGEDIQNDDQEARKSKIALARRNRAEKRRRQRFNDGVERMKNFLGCQKKATGQILDAALGTVQTLQAQISYLEHSNAQRAYPIQAMSTTMPPPSYYVNPQNETMPGAHFMPPPSYYVPPKSDW